ncbi:MAG: GEVED domain-containing protein [Bacteroidales bacterium]|jgi:hypothetical protein|nr:GEVED domain-containing protein [Bacteroidales bacterium]
MKKTILLSFTLFTFLCVNTLQAQVNIGGDPMSYKYEKTGILEPLTFEQMPPIDMSVIEVEDAQWEADREAGIIKIGRRFGIEFEVDYDLHNSGIWTYLPDGGKLWRLGIECPGALSINLIFDQYRLPKGATLYIFGENKLDKIGGFTDYNNQADNFFATDIVLNDKIIIEYYQPGNAEFDGEMRIATIIHGYRGLSLSAKLFGESGACQRNTICPEGEGWEDQIKSVFALYSGSTEVCSGSIVNNTANDRTPYALTANHCWEAKPNPGIWVFRFNWESPTCTPTTNSTHQSMTGATLKVRTATTTASTDACLVELNQPIPEDYGVFYAGWSRSTVPSPSGMCIHHPSLDIKKISPTYPLYTVTQYVLGWRADWSTGACTEGGSSGSPLFDSDHRIVGQLYGGLSKCGAPPSSMFDVYGRFDISWDATPLSSSGKIKDYLDPLNLDPETWDGRYGQIVDAELAAIIIPEDFYTSAATIEPKVTIKNSGDFPIDSASVSYTIDGDNPVTKTWTGLLDIDETVDITFDAITLTYGVHVFEATVVVEDDGKNTNDTKSKTFEVVIEDGPYLAYDSHEVVGGDLLTYISTNTPIQVVMKNVGVVPTPGPITVTISCDDPLLTINNATAQITNVINAGGTATVLFNITIDHSILDGKSFPVIITASQEDNAIWKSKMTLIAFAPKFSLETVKVNGSETGNLTAGSVATITAVVKNKGGADAYNVKGTLEIFSDFIDLACPDVQLAGKILPAGETIELDFVIITAPEMPYGHEADINLLLTAQYGLSASDNFTVSNAGSDSYCTPGSTNCASGAGDKFTSVIIIKNSDQTELLNNPSTTCATNGYQNFTNMSFTLEPEQQYTIKVKCAYGSDYVRGWFDLNGNNIFDSNEQLIQVSCPTPNAEYTTTFSIPQEVTPGEHRFRLRVNWNTYPPNACDAYTYGQTHDYTFVIPELYARPQNVVAELDEETITTTWEAPVDGTPEGYNIYRNNSKLNDELLTETTFTEEDITEGVYVYNVTAVYEGNKESYSAMSNVICNILPPDPEFCEPPVNLQGDTIGNIAIITWDEPENIDGILLGYYIYRDEAETPLNEELITEKEYRDEELEDGTYQYNVETVYEHCISEMSESVIVTINTVGIHELQIASYELYPNPTNGNVTIEGKGLNRVEIYDVQGRKLVEYNSVTDNLQINVNKYENGIYFVKLFSEKNMTVTKRLVIIK